MIKESHLHYIKQIDGFRAFAVTLVIIFHLNERYLPGGFIGVDLFFTISGFIITRLIINDISNNNFKFLNFYHRRICRLLPALTVTILITLLFSFFVFSEERISFFSKTGIYSLISFSNIFFWLDSGYFDNASQNNIFLHTWSLSVEEQFYLIWPVLIFTLICLKKLNLFILGAITLLSLAFTFLLNLSDPNAAFYFMPSRIAQFSTGSLLAYLFFSRNLTTPDNKHFGMINNAFFIFGMGFVVFSSFISDGDNYDLFSSFILPTIGALFVLLGIQSQLSNTVFNNRICSYLGKISYSLYLVHWPIIILFSNYWGKEQFIFLEILIIVFIFIFANTLHYGIEKPLRLSQNRNTDKLKTFVTLILFISAIVICAHLWNIPSNKITQLHLNKSNSPSINNKLISYSHHAGTLWKQRSIEGKRDIGCQIGLNDPFEKFNKTYCLREDPNEQKILIIGDSYTAETYIMLSQFIDKKQILMAGTGGCWPIYPEPNWPNRKDGCKAVNDLRFKSTRRKDVAAIVITGNWRHWKKAHLLPTLRYLLLSKKPIIFMGVRPSFQMKIPNLLDSPLGNSVAKKLNPYFAFDIEAIGKKLKSTIDLEDSKQQILYINLMDFFCPENNCSAFTPKGELFYLDNAHISAAAAANIGREINKKLGTRIKDHISVQKPFHHSREHINSSAPQKSKEVLNSIISLNCDGFKNSASFSKEYLGVFKNNILKFKKGTYGEQRYEKWNGSLTSDGSLLIEGEYIEGQGGIKKIKLSAYSKMGNWTGGGFRGPRKCRIKIKSF